MTQPFQTSCCCDSDPPPGGCPTVCDACPPTFCIGFQPVTMQCGALSATTYSCGVLAVSRSNCTWFVPNGGQPCVGSQPFLPPMGGGISCDPQTGKWGAVLTAFSDFGGSCGSGQFVIRYEPAGDATPCPQSGTYSLVYALAQGSMQLLSYPQTVEVYVCDGPPPVDLGACCFTDGSCVEATQAACELLGGAFNGSGSLCATTDCPVIPPPLGACCLPSGACVERTQASCLGVPGATWSGPNTTCTPNPCGGTGGQPGACCIPQQGGVFGLCFNNVGEIPCLQAQGLYLGDNTTCGFTDCPPPPYGSGRSSGFGDTLAKFFRATGIERLVKRRAARTGKPCNCPARQAALNKLIPYSKGTTT